jgi:hypothetical protein
MESQREYTYIPLHLDRVASEQPYEDTSALVEQARQDWGYGSFQACVGNAIFKGEDGLEG